MTLATNEKRVVRRVALDLALHWDADPVALAQTILGLYGEYAVVKYLNQRLGANPPILFNAEYRNGGDGGFDFEFPHKGVTWDVKTTNQRVFKKDHLLNTK